MKMSMKTAYKVDKKTTYGTFNYKCNKVFHNYSSSETLIQTYRSMVIFGT